jgi:fanconi-associated nuclease 1
VILNPDFYRLIERINILDERSTLFPKSLLLPALLTCFRKRTYPDYKHTRTSNIWSSREDLIQYVAALELEAVLDQALESPNEPRKRGMKTPAPNTFVTPATPGPGRNITTPLKTPRSSSAIRRTETPTSVKKEAAPEEMAEGIKGNQVSVLPETLAKLEKAKRVKEIFDTLIIPRWMALVVAKHEEGAQARPSALERFEPGQWYWSFGIDATDNSHLGFVYTRLFRRVQDALRTLKDYQGEADVLEALLGQRHWRRRKRGTWYERRAILQTRHLCRVDDVKDDSMLFEALAGVEEALKDEDTGLGIYFPLISA